jgi:hypothetical protein
MTTWLTLYTSQEKAATFLVYPNRLNGHYFILRHSLSHDAPPSPCLPLPLAPKFAFAFFFLLYQKR